MSRDRRRLPPPGKAKDVPPETSPASHGEGAIDATPTHQVGVADRRSSRRTTLGGIIGFKAEEMVTRAEVNTERAHAELTKARAEHGEQQERLWRQVGRLDKLDAIIATDNLELEADFLAAEAELARFKREATAADEIAEIEALERKVKKARLEKEFQELHNPPKKVDPSIRIREIQAEMQAVSDELSDPSLPEDRKAELRQRRRQLNTELDALRE